MRLLPSLILFAVLVEVGSGYFLYRHFAGTHRPFNPVGSAAVTLAHYVQAKLRHQRDEATLSVDHGPLFRADDRLGFALNPGAYVVTETLAEKRHSFHITVDEAGRRITARRPNGIARRILITGDSAIFGWAVEDENTIAWLIQARFPDWNVLNMSLTSYSTFQNMTQLGDMAPKVSPNDIVVLTYHWITNELNSADDTTLGYLQSGFERALGDSRLEAGFSIPYGSIAADGTLTVSRIPVLCADPAAKDPVCRSPRPAKKESEIVTMRAFDGILDAYPAHYVVAYFTGDDDDPVIAHLRSRGVVVADLRTTFSDPDATDEVALDGHAGAFWQYRQAEKLGNALVAAGLTQEY